MVDQGPLGRVESVEKMRVDGVLIGINASIRQSAVPDIAIDVSGERRWGGGQKNRTEQDGRDDDDE